MHRYTVGELYDPTRRHWPESIQYAFRSGGHELFLSLEDPSRDEILAVRKAPARIGLVLDGPVIDLVYQFGDELTGDAPYSWHLVAPDERVPPQILLNETTRAMITTILVDASTRLIRAMRQSTLSPALSMGLHAAITEQISMPWNPVVYDRTLARLHARCPTITDLWRESISTCALGA